MADTYINHINNNTPENEGITVVVGAKGVRVREQQELWSKGGLKYFR